MLFAFFIISAAIAFFIFKLNPSICANSISCISDLSGKENVSLREGIFMGKKVKIPDIAVIPSDNNVLGTTISNKHIYVDLTNQKLLATENGNKVMEFLISSGKWGQTPTGDFMTWIKVKSTRMKGGSKELGTYYDLPNVPYTMFFHNQSIPRSRGYGIHGAYWHNNFGHPMSHGCINLKPEDAKTLYEWANPISDKVSILVDDNNPGTPITIFGTATMY